MNCVSQNLGRTIKTTITMHENHKTMYESDKKPYDPSWLTGRLTPESRLSGIDDRHRYAITPKMLSVKFMSIWMFTNILL